MTGHTGATSVTSEHGGRSGALVAAGLLSSFISLLVTLSCHVISVGVPVLFAGYHQEEVLQRLLTGQLLTVSCCAGTAHTHIVNPFVLCH
mgnify:CR=1 FL=1